MTWNYKITDKNNLSVYDHAGNHVTTVMNDGSGIKLPDMVLEVMESECMSRGFDLSDPYVVSTLQDAVFENIEEGAP